MRKSLADIDVLFQNVHFVHHFLMDLDYELNKLESRLNIIGRRFGVPSLVTALTRLVETGQFDDPQIPNAESIQFVFSGSRGLSMQWTVSPSHMNDPPYRVMWHVPQVYAHYILSKMQGSETLHETWMFSELLENFLLLSEM